MKETDYTFENFDVDRRNRFAYEAAKAVADEPGGMYNPLLLYGNRYDGKTHLLKAMENRIKESNPSLNVIYVTGEEFESDFAQTLKFSWLDLFRNTCRNCDVFILDGIDYLMDMQSVSMELFFILDELLRKGKQVVISSDRKPKKLGELDELFRGRLEMGLVIGIRN
jgi:chromosomal replication initiator protein